MAAKIQFRRDTAANWASVNPILSQGEIGQDTSNSILKIGDGIAPWDNLPTLTISESAIDTKISDLVGGAPGALDTLNELAEAINDDASYASTVTTALGTKTNKTSNQSLSSSTDAMTISDHTITLTRGDGSTDVVTIPDNNTTYSVQDGELSEKSFTSAEKTKLGNIEDSATADQSASEIKTAYESNTDTNEFSDAEQTKLSGIEGGADVTDTTNVVASLTAGTNVAISAGGTVSSTDTTYSVGDNGLTQKNFTTTLKTKLDGVEASADVTDTTNVVSALTAGTNVAISAGGTVSSTDTTYSVGDNGLTQKNFTTTLKTKLDDVEASADVTDTTNVVSALTAGTNVTIAGDGTISSTDTNTNTTYTAGTGLTLAGTVFSASPLALTSVQTATNQVTQLALTAQEGDIVVRSDENKTYCHNGGTAGTMADYTLLATPTDAVSSVNGDTGAVSVTHDGLSDFVANEHIDWTADQGATNLHAGNYTDTTYSVGDNGLTQKNFTTTLQTKLDNIEESATNYTHPATHSISEVVNLQTMLDSKTAEAVAMAIALG